ncbi:MAG: sulfotransferase family protein [Halothece sp.]
MIKPNFLIIGAARSGTTSLHSYLQQHPQIYMPDWKEPSFFCQLGINPSDRPDGIADFETYYSLFNEVSNEIAIGEASTLYIYYKNAPIQIKKHLPNVKLIALLRNPVDRAYSSFLHSVGPIANPLTNFRQAIKARQNKTDDIIGDSLGINSLGMGFYYTQLKRYYECFDHHQIKVYLYEYFKEKPISILQDIFNFLEVDSNFLPDVSFKKHITHVYKHQFLYQFSKSNYLRACLKALMPKPIFNRIKARNIQKPQELTLEIREELLQEYISDILQLQELIQQDLSIWLKT